MQANVTIFEAKEIGIIASNLNRMENTLKSYDSGTFDAELTIRELRNSLKRIREVYC